MAGIISIKKDLADNTVKGGRPAPSALVYEAVLDGGVTTTAGFETWFSSHTRS